MFAMSSAEYRGRKETRALDVVEAVECELDHQRKQLGARP